MKGPDGQGPNAPYESPVAARRLMARDSEKLMSVTLDRLLHFGEHCANLQRMVRPLVAQLRKLASHSWGHREHHLRTVASG